MKIKKKLKIHTKEPTQERKNKKIKKFIPEYLHRNEKTKKN